MTLTKNRQLYKTRLGDGTIQRVDTTYSIPLYLIKLTTGKHKGAMVALTQSEIEQEAEQ